jgi:FSR family fosmidomycin resistance protein-like MFS transporter
VVTVAAGHFIHDIYSSFLAPWLPLLIEKLSLSLTMAGSLTLFIRLPSLLNPIIGVAADRADMRYMVIAAPAITAVCMSLIGLASNYAMVAVLLVVVGLSAAAFHVPGPVMIVEVSGSRLGKGMSFFMAAGELARTVGPLVAVAAASLWGFEGTYPVMVFGLAASAVLFWRLRRVSVQGKVRERVSLEKAWRTLRHVLVPLAFLIVARGLMVASLTAFLPTFMAFEGKSLWVGGGALALLQFAGVLGSLTSGTASDRLGRRLVLLVSMAASPALMLLFLATKTWTVFLVLVGLGFAVFSAAPVMLAIVQEHAPGMRATANGIYMGINFVVISGITLFVGWLGDILGIHAAFAWCAVLAWTGVPVILFLPSSLVPRG